MAKIPIKHKQSVLDLSVQAFGSMDAFMDMAVENDISITENLTPGDELSLPEFSEKKTDIIAFYNKNQIKPSTALLDDSIVTFLEALNNGIGYWVVENNFVVQ